MTLPARLLLLSSIILAGCGTARHVAVTSFRVLDTPARYVRDRIDPPETTTTTTTRTVQTSDVSNPGVEVPPPAVTQPTPTKSHNRSTASSENNVRQSRAVTSNTPPRTSASVAPRPSSSSAAQFPTARPVPGKPGYVYSVDPKGGIVDVTGYKSGDKAKDPYTQQIFIVP
jgi:hypothetical protein